jgi:hypothetical protein
MQQYVDIGKRVYCSRPDPAFLSEVPLLLIYFSDEESDDKGSSPKIYTKIANLIFEILQRQENDVDDFLDSRAFEVEHAMEIEKCLGIAYVQDVTQRRSIPTTISSEGNENIASLKVHFEVEYLFEPFSNITLDEFLTFNNKIVTIGGAESEDDVTIRSE